MDDTLLVDGMPSADAPLDCMDLASLTVEEVAEGAEGRDACPLDDRFLAVEGRGAYPLDDRLLAVDADVRLPLL